MQIECGNWTQKERSKGSGSNWFAVRNPINNDGCHMDSNCCVYYISEGIGIEWQKEEFNTQGKLKSNEIVCFGLQILKWIWNIAAVALCEKTIVERMMSALELKCNVWILIEVKQPRKKIGKVRRNMIGLPGNKNDRLLIYLKVQDWQGIKRHWIL